jgi:manganese/zinc/iron transport system substrate-binding protein
MKLLLLLALFLLIFGCENTDNQENSKKNSTQKLQIVCTTGMIADVVKNIVGDSAEVKTLMNAGVDPHLYKATQGDLALLSNADIIFYNGLHLEGKMSEMLAKLANRKKVVAVADGIDKTKLIEVSANTYDPHIWFDVTIWAEGAKFINKNLQALQPQNTEYFEKNTTAYLYQLDTLHLFITESIKNIPPTQRVLITSHDAFEYFGKAYKIEVKGLQGLSTLSDFGIKDITDMVNMIIQRKIKSVFVESSVSSKSIEAVVEGCKEKKHTLSIGGTLYSDAMGADNTPEGTYIGMMTKNTITICQALK